MAGAATLFAGDRVDPDDMAIAMRHACERTGQMLDPHTAIGLAAARRAGLPAEVPVVTLATAHPAKFRDAVERATGVAPAAARPGRRPVRPRGTVRHPARHAGGGRGLSATSTPH